MSEIQARVVLLSELELQAEVMSREGCEFDRLVDVRALESGGLFLPHSLVDCLGIDRSGGRCRGVECGR